MPAPFSIQSYTSALCSVLKDFDWTPVEKLAERLFECWKSQTQVFLCGNGGSAANAEHLANDFLYGINPEGRGLQTQSLADNAAVLTCLANDTGYDNIYCHQLKTKARSGDLLVVFSGSGNSPNIVRAIETAKAIGMETSAILGFDGGACKDLVDTCIHFKIHDMQIAEDLQQIVGHILSRTLKERIASN